MSEQDSYYSVFPDIEPLSVSDITKLLANMDNSLVDTANGVKIKDSPSPVQTQTEPAETLTPTQYFPAKQLTEDDLAARDRNAIAYSKSLMEVGNTLVYITYSGNTLLYDHTGFRLTNKPNRVHSANLLATGSKVFHDLLLDDWKQHRARKRKGFLSKAALPSGIEYILDLTPPDEGDEAVDLISDLSCSPGICHWYSAEQRCGVHHSLVGGKDEVAKPRDPIAGLDKDTSPDPLEDSRASFAPVNPFIVGDVAFGQNNDNKTNQDNDSAFLRTLRRSKEEHTAAAKAQMQFDPDAKQRALKVEETQEYCPIRHRAGIERLLQVIEGKDPRLDSAPKVWTLFVLAKYFDCTNKVLDYIVSWMLAEPNCQFIEILPEVSYKIGNGLQSAIIARPAFAVLVSEEAMNVASRMTGKFEAAKQRTNRFLRAKEDIDENSLDAIQAAAHEFQSRVQKVFDDLVDPNMDWFSKLPEYRKLREFLRQSGQYSQIKASTDNLIDNLRRYVRGRILSVIAHQVPFNMITDANDHRRAESYLKPSTIDFQAIYSSLADRERIMTKFFWRMVRDSPWSIANHSSNAAFHLRNGPAYENVYGVKVTNMLTIGALQYDVNSAILLAIKEKGFNKGVIPFECYQHTTFGTLETPGGQNNQLKSSSTDWCLDLPSNHTTEKASSPAANIWKFQGDSHKENEKTSDITTPNYLYSISAQQPGPVYAWEEVAASVFADSKSVDPRVWNRRVINVKANFELNGWHVPTHPFDSNEGYFEYLAYLDQERDTNIHWTATKATQASKKVKYTDCDTSSMNGLYEFPYRPRPVEDGESDEEPLLQKEPKHPIDLEKSARPETPNLKPENDSYTYSAAVKAASNNGSSFEEKLLGKLNSQSGRVVLSPMSFRPPKTQDVGAFGKIKKVFDGSTSAGLYSTTVNTYSYDTTSLLNPHPALQSDPTFKQREARVPKEININTQSPFFSITNFLVEVSAYVRATTSEMLCNNEVDFCALTDTLLCLSENEFKYLPLWAGGNEDGSGGVYDPEMPPAHLGPNGPGPAYHTGFSTNSRASTDVDWDGSSSVDTSIAVENGHSDHIDRRIVQSDDGFGTGTSVTFSEGSNDYGPGDIKGKGKAVEDDLTPKTSTAPSAIDDDDFMNVSDDELELEVSGDELGLELSDGEEEWDDATFE